MTLLSYEHRAPSRWGGRLERLLLAMVVVGVVSAGVRWLTDESPSQNASSGTASSPAASSPQEVAIQLEARAAKDPDNPAVWQQLAAVYVERGAQTLDPSFYGRATAAAERAGSLDPEAAATLGAQAAVAASLHRFADAATFAERALVVDPFDPGAMAVLVDAQIELGRYDDAERTLQTFADRKPGAPVLSRVSYLRELHGDLDGAIAAMTEARQAAAGAGSYQRATLAAYDGDLLWGSGRLVDAARAYDDALALEPRHPVATVGRARALAAGGDFEAATALLADFVDRTPVPAAALLLGELQAAAGDLSGAETSFALVAAMSKLQADAGVDVDIDLALFEADHSPVTPAVVATVRQAAAARPTVHASDALAWTLYRAGDIVGARGEIDAALRLGSREPLLRFHAAAILHAAGDDGAAREHLQFVASRNPWFSVGLQPEARALAGQLGVEWPARPAPLVDAEREGAVR